MKLKCRFVGVEVTPNTRSKRKADEESLRSRPAKRHRIEGGGTGKSREQDQETQEVSKGWEDVTTALRIIGVRISEMTRVMSEINTGVSEIAKNMKSASDTAKESLVELRDLTWVQDQTRGVVHLVAKRLESLDGVERVLETRPELKKFREETSEGADVKGKGKEVVPESKDGSEVSEGEEEEEDVVKGPEISTLDVDESMEVEKEE